MDLSRLKEIGNKHPLIVYVTLGFISLIIVFLLMNTMTSKAVIQATEKKQRDNSQDIGISVGGVDKEAYLARLEKNYYDFEDRIKSVEGQMRSIEDSTKKLTDDQKQISNSILKMNENLVRKMDEHLEKFRDEISMSHTSQNNQPPPDVELAIADITPVIDKDDHDSVYLPLGSFCKGTLLTGVYAAADQNNPLPVLISLDEAFYGPNKTRIPLKGAFVLGKAYGDIVSERALIQIIAISSVLPDSVTFENEQNLGYVTDAYGELGIHGQVIRNTGSQLALSFMGGFAAGGSQALADQEVTERRDSDDHLIKEVTGNTTKNALFSGLAQSAGKLSEYYAKQAENLIPAIHIKNGQNVYFIVQKGVTIHGLSRLNVASGHYMD